MNFLIYDERGEIVQSNKVYDHENYGDLLHSRDMKFVEAVSDEPLHMNDFWVARGQLTGRPEMPFNMNKSTFKADGLDGAVITGLPRPCKVTITVTGDIKIVDNEECTLGEVEVSSPVAAEYSILIEAFPYKPRTFKVMAL